MTSKLLPPAPLSSYVLKYLEYHPDTKLASYNVRLCSYGRRVHSNIPEPFSNELFCALLKIVAICSTVRATCIAVSLFMTVTWIFAPFANTSNCWNSKGWNELLWLLWNLPVSYLVYSFFSWFEDTKCYWLVRDYEAFFEDENNVVLM